MLAQETVPKRPHTTKMTSSCCSREPRLGCETTAHEDDVVLLTPGTAPQRYRLMKSWGAQRESRHAKR